MLTAFKRKVFHLWNQYNFCKHVKGKSPAVQKDAHKDSKSLSLSIGLVYPDLAGNAGSGGGLLLV